MEEEIEEEEEIKRDEDRRIRGGINCPQQRNGRQRNSVEQPCISYFANTVSRKDWLEKKESKKAGKNNIKSLGG